MNNLSYRFKLRTDRAPVNGEYPIYLIFTKDRKRQFISINISTDKEYWDCNQERLIIEKGLRKETAKKENEDRKVKNQLINRYSQTIEDIIAEAKRSNKNLTLTQLKEKFLNSSKESKFKLYIEKHISTLKETNHVGNANTYSITLKMLNNFDKKLDKKVFDDIDIKYIKSFDIWMQKRGCKSNTRMHYHKKIRAIWNHAITDKEVSAENYPFGRNGFSVGQLEEETEKRYLPSEDLEKIKTSISLVPNREFARNVFLLSYYLYGMSFRDMGLLKKKNIIKLNNGKYIVYKRTKTKHVRKSKPISIRMTDEIETIISNLVHIKSPIHDFLLPLVSKNKETEDELYKHLTDRRKTIVGWMKELSTDLDLDINLTSYVSRHTMAMQLQEKEIPEAVISQVLGHKDLKTTKTYLDSLDTSVIDAAGEVL